MKMNVYSFQGMAGMHVQMATERRPGTPTSKIFQKRNFQVDILSTCYKISARSMEGKQQKYDAITDIQKRKRGL
jgi:hypothetical protein